MLVSKEYFNKINYLTENSSNIKNGSIVINENASFIGFNINKKIAKNILGYNHPNSLYNIEEKSKYNQKFLVDITNDLIYLFDDKEEIILSGKVEKDFVDSIKTWTINRKDILIGFYDKDKNLGSGGYKGEIINNVIKQGLFLNNLNFKLTYENQNVYWNNEMLEKIIKISDVKFKNPLKVYEIEHNLKTNMEVYYKQQKIILLEEKQNISIEDTTKKGFLNKVDSYFPEFTDNIYKVIISFTWIEIIHKVVEGKNEKEINDAIIEFENSLEKDKNLYKIAYDKVMVVEVIAKDSKELKIKIRELETFCKNKGYKLQVIKRTIRK